jgi:hypothetical protein
MLKEITELYRKQSELYESIYDLLKKFDKDDIDVEEYNKELQNIEFILEKIKRTNNRTEQLKHIYILKHKIDDFTGKDIKTVAKEEDYNSFKVVVDIVKDKIVSTKKLQDVIINRLNNQVNLTRQLISGTGNNKNTKPSYNKILEYEKSKYIDKKK